MKQFPALKLLAQLGCCCIAIVHGSNCAQAQASGFSSWVEVHGKIAAGGEHVIANSSEGTLTWGLNASSQLGASASVTEYDSPVLLAGLNYYSYVAAGTDHSLAVSNGRVYAWGDGAAGQLGQAGSTASSVTPVVVDLGAASGWAYKVFAGNRFSVALTTLGLYTWGKSDNGVLGERANANNAPQRSQVTSGSFVDVAPGGNHVLALKSNGDIFAWGANASGQLGDGGTTDSAAPLTVSMPAAAAIAAGLAHSLALTTTGAIYAWGANDRGQLGLGANPSNPASPAQVLTGVASLAAGRRHSIAILTNHTVKTWGANESGQLGLGNLTDQNTPQTVPGISGVIYAVAGDNYSVFVKIDGSLLVCGANTHGQLCRQLGTIRQRPVPINSRDTPASLMDQVAAVSAGGDRSYAVRLDGTVWAWGENGDGTLGGSGLGDQAVPAPVTASGFANIKTLSAGEHFAVALGVSGSTRTVWTWGVNDHGQLGKNTTTPSATPSQISGLANISAVAAGKDHALALTTSGTVYAWGKNAQGQIGNNSTSDQLVPLPVTGLTGIVAIAAGAGYSLALKSDHTLYAWGANNRGQLGDATTTERRTPVLVGGSGFNTVTAIVCGADHALALLADGTWRSWGDNAFGQLGYAASYSFTPNWPGAPSTVTSLAAGDGYSQAILRNGQTYSWGRFQEGQTGDVANSAGPHLVPALEGVSFLEGGGHHSLALKPDNRLFAFGASDHGQLGIQLSGTLSAVGVPGINVNPTYVMPHAELSGQVGGYVLPLGQNYQFALNAVSANTSAPISTVELYCEGVKIAQLTQRPYQFTWTPATWGDYTFTAVAVDVNGLRSWRTPPILLRVPRDLNGDGLPDWWAYQQFGNVTLPKTLGTADWDVDGMSNLYEYQYGSDPKVFDGSYLAGQFAHRVAAGSYHSLAIKSDGSVCAWGANLYGQLGVGSMANSAEPMLISGLSNVSSIAARGYYSAAIVGGTVKTWGANWYGQLGLGDTTPRTSPALVTGLPGGIMQVQAGIFNMFAIDGNKNLWGWGANWSRLVANNTTQVYASPVQIQGINDVTGVAVGGSHVLAVKSNGTVWGWGNNWSGAVGVPNSGLSGVPGQVLQVGGAALTGVIAVQASFYESFALKADGTVWAWGANWNGELGLGDNSSHYQATQVAFPGNRKIASLQASDYHLMAVAVDGSVWAWGFNGYGQLGNGTVVDAWSPTQVVLSDPIVTVVASPASSMFLGTDGNLRACGDNYWGQLGNGKIPSFSSAPQPIAGLAGIQSISATPSYGLNYGGVPHPSDAAAVSHSGELWMWGCNDCWQLGDGTLIWRDRPQKVPGSYVQVALGSCFTVALNSDGFLRTWGGDGFGGPDITPVDYYDTVTSIDAGDRMASLVDGNGALWTWGFGDSGQLGDGNFDEWWHDTPQFVSLSEEVTSAVARGSSVLASLADGSVYAWGANWAGQLGDGTTDNLATPHPVPLPAAVRSVASNGSTSLAISANNSAFVYGWGSNESGELGQSASGSIPVQVPSLSGARSLAAGSGFVLALAADSSPWGWGSNSNGQLGQGSIGSTPLPPTHLTALQGIIQIAAASATGYGLREDGTVIGWGDGRYGQLADGMGYVPQLSPAPVLGFNVSFDAPSAAIASPANNATVIQGRLQAMRVNVTPAAGGAVPERVKLYYRGIEVGEAVGAPFEFQTEANSWGDFEYVAVAVDAAGVYSKRSAPITLHVPYDSDGDGLPDWWELKFFGGLNLSSGGSTEDWDHDGYSDLYEYQHQTNPTATGTAGTESTGGPIVNLQVFTRLES